MNLCKVLATFYCAKNDDFFGDLLSKLTLFWEITSAWAITCTLISSLPSQVLGFLLALVFVLVWIMLQVVVATLLDHFVSGKVSIHGPETLKLSASLKPGSPKT